MNIKKDKKGEILFSRQRTKTFERVVVVSTVRPTRLKKSQIAIAMAAGHWHASGAASKVQVTGRGESGVSATGEGYPGGRERERGGGGCKSVTLRCWVVW